MAISALEGLTTAVKGRVVERGQSGYDEARALYSHSAADWLTAVAESELWLSDEPFASRPAVFGSFITAEHLEDFDFEGWKRVWENQVTNG